MPYNKLAAALLALTLAGAASAQTVTCSRDDAPSREQIMQWKKNVLDRYASVIYLDANGAPMPAEAFLRALHEKHLPIQMTPGEGLLALQLLAPPVTPDCA